MTAQAPYESPVSDAMVTAYLSAVHEHLGNLTTEEWATDRANPVASLARVARIGLTAALAALPERAPVSAGGDAVGYSYLHRPSGNLCANMGEVDAVFFKHNPSCEFVGLLYATPAPPVGEDWTDEQCIAFMAVALRHTEYKRGNGGPTLNEIRQGVRRALMLAAAPTPAEARGVGDGDAVTLAALRGEMLRHDADETHPYITALDRVIAALAANKPAGEVCHLCDGKGYVPRFGGGSRYCEACDTRQAQAQGSEAAHAQAGEGSNG